MLRRLQTARRLGGLAAALPRAAEPLEALRIACGPAALHTTHAALWGEGCGRGAASLPLGVARGFAAAAGGGDEPDELAAPVAVPPTREGAATQGDADAGLAAPAAGAAPDAARAKRTYPSVSGEKTASGRPKPDERTVARLVELGWWATPEAAEAALTTARNGTRYPYETAGAVIDWLFETLGEGKHRSGRSCAAQAAFRWPFTLALSTSLLQAGWEMVVQSREAGGLGLPVEVARQRVASYSQVLAFSSEFVEKRAAFLETLGVSDGRAAIGSMFPLLGVSESTLHNGAEWLRAQGFDVVRMVSAHPQLLVYSPARLSLKLDFMRNVVGLSNSEVLPVFLASSLDKMRPRYFYARQRGVEQRYTFSSLVVSADAKYLKMALSLPRGTHATAEDVAAYKAHIATPAFLAYMDEQGAAIGARGPRVKQ
jgi:hypothetical protein